MRTVLLAATIICFFIACKTGKGDAAKKSKDIARLNGGWELNYLSGTSGILSELYPGRNPKMMIDPGNKRASGNTGCNSFSGPITLDGNKISFNQPMILTKMFCPGEGETLFLENLKKVNSWVLDDDVVLHFMMDDVDIIRFLKVQ